MSDSSDKEWWQPAVILFAELSAWIVFPIIGGVYLGNWLDDRFQTSPWLFITTVGLAFLTTNVGIILLARKAFKDQKPELKKEKLLKREEPVQKK